MEAETRERAARRRIVLFAALAAGIVFAAVGAFVWTLGSSDSGTPASEPAGSTAGQGSAGTVTPAGPTIVSAAALRAAAKQNEAPLYWAGTRSAARIEYTRRSDGTTFVRYLTGGARAGDPGAGYVVVATYPQTDAYERVSTIAHEKGFATTELSDGGGLAVVKPGSPANIHVVYRDQPYQVEVYAPTAKVARQLVFGGAITPVG